MIQKYSCDPANRFIFFVVHHLCTSEYSQVKLIRRDTTHARMGLISPQSSKYYSMILSAAMYVEV